MPLVIAALGFIAAALFWYYRVRQVRDVAGDVVDAADDIRLAARRFGFRMKNRGHPADQIDDPRLAAAGVAAAVAEMDGPLTQDEISALSLEVRAILKASAEDAPDIAAFGRWIAGQCGHPEAATRRLSKVVLAKAGQAAGPDLIDLATRVGQATSPLDERQVEAIKQIQGQFGLSA